MKKILLFGTALVFAQPAYAVIPASNQIVFDIYRNGEPFGQHILKFKKEGDKTRVLIDISMKYDLGPITVFRYEHSNEEVWQGDKILSMASQTYDDGDDYAVKAIWGDVLKVDVTKDDKASAYEAPKELYTTSYWNKVSLKADDLINSQKGQIEDVEVTNLGRKDFTTGHDTVKADHYKVEASVPLELWYDAETDQWVGLRFKVRGSDIEYRRVTPIGAPASN